MKNFLSLVTLGLLSQLLIAQSTPALLKGGEKSPSFTYTECLNNLPKVKDRYCTQYDFKIFIKEDVLYIIETKISKSDQPKKSTSYDTEYKIKCDDIDIIRSLDNLKNGKDVSRIKNMEGSEQDFFRFTLYSKTVDGIQTMEYGKNVGLEEMVMYADFRSDAKDFFEYLMVQEMK